MALVLGDVHGNLDKAQKFIAHKPEETHVFVGDYVDSFDETDEQILFTLKFCIESDAILLLGNHDVHYFSEPPFTCSGYRHLLAKGLNEIFESFVTRFVPCLAVDGFIITHGGVSNEFGNSALKTKNVVEIANKIIILWDTYMETRFKRKPGSPRMHNHLFDISPTRGGMDRFSGPFWTDYRSDNLYGVPQVFGHSRTPLDNIIKVGPKLASFAIGCDNDRRICFNTTTKESEIFD
jgi:predicted phosphodiesterase